MDDPPYHEEDAEEDEEPADAVYDIVKFHDASPVKALADLDREGEDEDHRDHIQEGYDHRVSGLSKPEKDRVQYQDQGDPESSYHDKMKLFVREAGFPLVIHAQEGRVDPRDQHDEIIKKCFHLDSPFYDFCKSWSVH